MISYSWFNDCSLIGVVMFISTERKCLYSENLEYPESASQSKLLFRILFDVNFHTVQWSSLRRSLTENCIHLFSFVSSEETQIVSRQEKWTEKSVNKNIYTESWYTSTPKINTFLFVKVLSRSVLVQKIFSQRLRLCYFSASIMLLKENL